MRRLHDVVGGGFRTQRLSAGNGYVEGDTLTLALIGNARVHDQRIGGERGAALILRGEQIKHGSDAFLPEDSWTTPATGRIVETP